MNEIEEKVKALQEDNRLKIITLEENEKKASSRPFIDDFKAKSEMLFENFKKNHHNIKVDEVDEAINNLKNELDELFRKTLTLIKEEGIDEKVSDVLKTMRRGFKIIANDIKSNEKVRKVSDKVETTAKKVYEDERVQQKISSVKSKTMEVRKKLADKAADKKGN